MIDVPQVSSLAAARGRFRPARSRRLRPARAADGVSVPVRLSIGSRSSLGSVIGSVLAPDSASPFDS
jgi:hypothetical protein